MTNIIHQLPDSVANQIAAGEVIQRPAAVIKELVENSVDAGAQNISIIVKDAGRTLIQVIDDGKGMSPIDARMAFERHATSKISSADDLQKLVTMGFRGEALPSICAISQVELRTRTEADEIGTRLTINCSRHESEEPVVCDRGTNIMVKNIFCNFPARRKFLKSDNVELAHIMREFERLALVNNHIHLSIDTGGKRLDLRPASFKQRIADIWKNNLNLHLLPIEVDTSVVKISGYISRPEFARKRNQLQYLITNGRNMRHLYFHKAITSCYSHLIAPDTQPCYFLKFEVDPASIDVNIHPSKDEIKFEFEQEIWKILSVSVRAALGKFGAVPSIDFSGNPLPVATPTPAPGEFIDVPKVNVDPGYNPFADRQPSPGSPGNAAMRPTRVSSHWSELYSDFMKGVKESDLARTNREEQEHAKVFDKSDVKAPAPICFQHDLKYIITSSEEGILVIDQHRAHVKILYERYLQRSEMQVGTSQQIMFPQTLHLEPEQLSTFEWIEDEIARIGFTLQRSGEREWRIEAVPALLMEADPVDVILRILDSVGDDSLNYGAEGFGAEDMLRKVALLTARSTAITRGRQLSGEEMEHIVSQLFSLQDPMFTPNGNPIVRIIDNDTIASLFG